MQIKKLSNIETLMNSLGSSLSSLASKQEENLQKLELKQDVSHTEVKSLMDSLSSAVSTLRDKLTDNSSEFILNTQRFLEEMSKSLTDLEDLMLEVKSSIQSLSYKLSFANLLIPGCTESGWIPFRNSCYLFSHDSMDWTKAKNYCEEKGALLLKIEDGSEREWEFVTSTAKPQEYWIGLTDNNTGQWRWTDETPYTMNKVQWSPGQPDDWKDHKLGEEGEDCAHITVYGLLNDAHCSIKMNYICEMKKQV
uniref:Si:ch211-283g2.3 n=1 Tax=Cyprinus carpio TaxID=7962 RepID=A0A8C1Q718_CYPCA